MQTSFRCGPRIFDRNFEIGNRGGYPRINILAKMENYIVRFTCKLSSVNSTEKGMLILCPKGSAMMSWRKRHYVFTPTAQQGVACLLSRAVGYLRPYLLTYLHFVLTQPLAYLHVH